MRPSLLSSVFSVQLPVELKSHGIEIYTALSCQNQSGLSLLNESGISSRRNLEFAKALPAKRDLSTT